MADPTLIRVWDPFIRIFHWTLVAAFAIAYLTEGEPFWLHITAGFVVAGLVAARIVWGFVGPQHARFSDFVYGPSAIFGYLRNLFSGSAKRYLGHSPAGGAMVVALLLALAGTTGTGAYMYFTGSSEKQQGETALTDGSEDEEVAENDAAGAASAEGREREENPLEEVHEFFANLTLLLVILHLGGVAAASFAHRENLPRSMVTGVKRA